MAKPNFRQNNVRIYFVWVILSLNLMQHDSHFDQLVKFTLYFPGCLDLHLLAGVHYPAYQCAWVPSAPTEVGANPCPIEAKVIPPSLPNSGSLLLDLNDNRSRRNRLRRDIHGIDILGGLENAANPWSLTFKAVSRHVRSYWRSPKPTR